VRTTLDLDAPVLAELKALGIKEGRSISQLASQLLAESLATRAKAPPVPPNVRWIVRKMGARVDLSDKDAVYRMLDR